MGITVLRRLQDPDDAYSLHRVRYYMATDSPNLTGLDMAGELFRWTGFAAGQLVLHPDNETLWMKCQCVKLSRKSPILWDAEIDLAFPDEPCSESFVAAEGAEPWMYSEAIV